MQTQTQIRQELDLYKKNSRYTWDELSSDTGLNVFWLKSFMNDANTSYSYEKMRTLYLYLKKQDKQERVFP